MRCAHRDDGASHLRLEYRHGPGQQTTPAMPDDDCLPLPQALQDGGYVLAQGEGVVAMWRVVRSAVAAQIHRDRAIARIGQRTDLSPPGPPECRESVQEQYGRSLTSFDDMDDDIPF